MPCCLARGVLVGASGPSFSSLRVDYFLEEDPAEKGPNPDAPPGSGLGVARDVAPRSLAAASGLRIGRLSPTRRTRRRFVPATRLLSWGSEHVIRLDSGFGVGPTRSGAVLYRWHRSSARAPGGSAVDGTLCTASRFRYCQPLSDPMRPGWSPSFSNKHVARGDALLAVRSPALYAV